MPAAAAGVLEAAASGWSVAMVAEDGRADGAAPAAAPGPGPVLRTLATNANDAWPGVGADGWLGLIAANGPAAGSGAPKLAAANGWPASLANSADDGWPGVGVGSDGWPVPAVVAGVPEEASGWSVALLAEDGQAEDSAPLAGAVEPSGGAAKGWLGCVAFARQTAGAPGGASIKR